MASNFDVSRGFTTSMKFNQIFMKYSVKFLKSNEYRIKVSIGQH